MRGRVNILVCFGFGVVLLCNLSNLAGGFTTSGKLFVSGGGCLTEDELAKAVLSLSGSFSEATESARNLRELSKRSSICRQRIIAAVMRAMDKPNLDISRDQASADLWREGATLLGDLKAGQALDLLLSHMTMSDHEWSITMTQQPALDGIIRMGPMAIPKLRVMLRSPDRETRHDSVYCIAWIGGASARRALQQALPKETDPCVKRFISVSINTINIKSGGLKNNRGQWLSAFLCHEGTTSTTDNDSGM